MGMGAEKGGYPPVRVIGEGLLFRRGLRVEVHNAELRMPCFLQQPVQRFKRAGQRFHIYHAHQVDDRDLETPLIHHTPPFSGGGSRVIPWTDDTGRAVEKLIEFPAPGRCGCRPVIASAPLSRMCSAAAGVIPVAVGGVLAVDNTEVHSVLALYYRKQPPQMGAAGRTHNIAYTENIHGTRPSFPSRQPAENSIARGFPARCAMPFYFANSTARFSRIRCTLICPG